MTYTDTDTDTDTDTEAERAMIKNMPSRGLPGGNIYSSELDALS